ncbi:MAG: NosD domain-containing protein, partial [Armatimonadota bacterium]
TVQAGIDAASSNGGGEIWVAAGTYNEHITLKSYCYLYGGFAGTESVKSQRNFSANKSILDGCNGNNTLSVYRTGALACIDGFTVRNSYTGINCTSSCPKITNNTIINHSTGIYCYMSSLVINSNIISENSNSGIYGYLNSDSIVVNNTILQNNNGVVVACLPSECPTIINNIVAFNTVGVYNSEGDARIKTIPTLSHNCVYGNTINYSGITASPTDISADPMFKDRTNGDYHLLSGSPCINTGDDAVVSGDWIDMDSEARIGGSHVDIGADEWGVTVVGTKRMANSASVRLNDVAVSAVFDGFYYIQDINRASGMRVIQMAGNLPQVGSVVSVSGVLTTTQDGEKCLSSYEQPMVTGQQTVLPALVVCKSIGGGNYLHNHITGAGQKGITGASGLNNIGLLVSVCGKIMDIDTTAKRLYINDGSADVAVYYGDIVLPESVSEGSIVKVTGACSCYKLQNGDLGRLIILKDADSIIPAN